MTNTLFITHYKNSVAGYNISAEHKGRGHTVCTSTKRLSKENYALLEVDGKFGTVGK